MQPQKIQELAPHWGSEVRLVPSEPIQKLHDATTQLNDLVDRMGEPVDPDDPILQTVREHLTLDPIYEAFIGAQIMPVHDTFLKDEHAVNSRFLVVDSRNAFAESDVNEPYPLMRMRAYFLIVDYGDGLPGDPTTIFPYFVVSASEAPVSGSFTYAPPDVFHTRYSRDMPLETGEFQPRRVHEMDAYEAM